MVNGNCGVPGTLAFSEACQRVELYASNPYAKTYARAGRRMTDRESIAAQAQYILANLGAWHGEQARMVKAQLRQFTAL